MGKGKVYLIREIHAFDGSQIAGNTFTEDFFEKQTSLQTEKIREVNPSYVFLELTESELAYLNGQGPSTSTTYHAKYDVFGDYKIDEKVETKDADNPSVKRAFTKVIEASQNAGAQIIPMDEQQHKDAVADQTFRDAIRKKEISILAQAHKEVEGHYKLMDSIWQDAWMWRDSMDLGSEYSHLKDSVQSKVKSFLDENGVKLPQKYLDDDLLFVNNALRTSQEGMKEAEFQSVAIIDKVNFMLAYRDMTAQEQKEVTFDNRERVWVNRIERAYFENPDKDLVVIMGAAHGSTPDSYLLNELGSRGIEYVDLPLFREAMKQKDDCSDSCSTDESGCSGSC